MENLAVCAVAAFAVVQGVIAFFSVLLWTKVFHFSPSAGITDNPVKELLPTGVYAAIVLVSVVVFRRFLRADMWKKSPFRSDLRPRVLLGALLVGLLPLVLHVAYGAAFLETKISWRPGGEPLAGAIFAAFLGVCFINAAIEELAFRTTPLALLTGARAIFAFVIPTIVFVLAHFLEPQRALSLWRVLELGSAALLFFLVANDFGFLAATLTHTALNLGYFLTDGSWRIGAFADVHWNAGGDAWIIGDCAAIWAAMLVYLTYSLRVRRRRARSREMVLSLTPT